MLNSKFLFLSLVAFSAFAYEPTEKLNAIQFNRPETALYRSIRSVELSQGRLGMKRIASDVCLKPSEHSLKTNSVLLSCSTVMESQKVEVCIETKGIDTFLNSLDLAGNPVAVQDQEPGEEFSHGDIRCKVILK